MRRSPLNSLMIAAICFLLFSQLALGQASKKLTIPKVESLPLETRDGLTIHCAYYPGGFIQKSETEIVAKPGKEVVPIILLHGYGGQGGDFSALAYALQLQGHAVMVPDLRGHGASKNIRLPNGDVREIDLEKMRGNNFATMVNDVEVIKKDLYDKNNEGLLNVEMLCLIGADLGGIVATNWIALDWNRKDLPAFKQGKSAKGLVVLSPQANVRAYNSAVAWKHPLFSNNNFSIMFVVGRRDTKSYNEAKQLFNRLERFHPLPQDEAERAMKQSLFLIEADTELSGTKLVDPRAGIPMVASSIIQFINLRFVNQKDDPKYTWAERKNPLE